MSVETDLTFLQKYHRDIIYVLLAILAIFGAVYVKDRLHAEKLAQEQQVINSLSINAAKLEAVKQVADNNAQNTLNIYKQEHQELLKALSSSYKAPTTPQTHIQPLPDAPLPTTLPEANTELEQVKKDDNDCVKTVNSLQDDIKADNDVIANNKEVIYNVDIENSQLKKDIKTQTSRKKAWRDTALAEAAILILHFLL
jgi:hypothetical protein